MDRRIKNGDVVRLVSIPPILPNGDAQLDTRAVFQKCLGHEFQIAGFNELGMAEIVVESVTGHVGETIWVEPEFLKLVSK